MTPSSWRTVLGIVFVFLQVAIISTKHLEPIKKQVVFNGLTVEEEDFYDEDEASDSPTPTLWNVTDPTTNLTCILLRAAISISVNYTDVYNTTRFVGVHVPSSAIGAGHCKEKEGLQQSLTITWAHDSNGTSPKVAYNSIEFIFQNVGGNGSTLGDKYAIVKITAVLQKLENVFPNASNPQVPFVIGEEGLSALETKLNNSYACSVATTKISVNPSKSVTPVEPDSIINLEDLQLEAFRSGGDKPNEFVGGVEHCAADNTSGDGSVVGTVVTTILVIVLVALAVAAVASYILKKRRAAGPTGYENM